MYLVVRKSTTLFWDKNSPKTDVVCDYDSGPCAQKVQVLNDIKLEPNTVNFVDVVFDSKEYCIPVENFGCESKAIETNEFFGESIRSIEPAKILESRSDKIEMHQIMTDESVTLEQREELLALLNEYRKCIATDVSEIGMTKAIMMDIELKNKDAVVHSKPII